MVTLDDKFDEQSFKTLNNHLKYLGGKNLTRREYLEYQEETDKKLKKLAEKIKYCGENGHLSGSEHISSGQSGTLVYGVCKRCDMSYKRNLTIREQKEFDRTMNAPMTI